MASIKNLLSSITVLLVVTAFTPYVWGFKCYQCNSFEDKDCEVITNNTRNPFLKDCDIRLAQNKPIFCRKIVQNIQAFEKIHSRVIRKCSYERSEKDCYHFEDDDHSETVCQCFTEACNGGHRSVTPGSLWRTAVPVLIAVLASFGLAARL